MIVWPFALIALLAMASLSANARECLWDDIQACSFAESLKGRKPNVVVIVADDLGWGDISPYGNVRSITPNLRRLVKKGVLFTDFYVASSVCSPSRAGYFTGVSPGRLGIFSTLHWGRNGFKYNTVDHLWRSVPNIARSMKKAGYATGHFGKWHLGDAQWHPSPEDYGIDAAYAWKSKGRHPELVTSALQNPHHFAELDQKVFDKALDFIGDNVNKPFFTNIWTFIPHAPLHPTDEQLARFNQAQGGSSVFKEHINPQQNELLTPKVTAAQRYFASIMEMDRQIGRVLDTLEQNGLTEKTIVLFFSDNGPEKMTLPTTSNYTFGLTGPFRGRKFSLYEGGIRVPAIVSWPGVFGENVVDRKSVISSLDIYPTLMGLTGDGDDQPKGDGENVLPAFLGLGHKRQTDLYWYYPGIYSVWGPVSDASPVLAIRSGKYKLLTNIDESRVELYDVSMNADPFELDNLAVRLPDVTIRLRNKALAFYSSQKLPSEKDHLSKHAGKRNFFRPRQLGKPRINATR